MEVINLVGTVFGKLSVIGLDNHKKEMYICNCQCGNTVIRSRSRLQGGKTKSCGKCWRDEFPIGTIVGLWHVIGIAFYKDSPPNGPKGLPHILCRCECGGENYVSLGNLRRAGNRTGCSVCGHKACGVAAIARFAKNRINYVGQTLKGIKVLNQLGMRKSFKGGKFHSIMWYSGYCTECGKYWEGEDRYLRTPKTVIACGCRVSSIHKERHADYRESRGFARDDAMTPYNKAVRTITSPLHAEVKRRDGFQCSLCGTQSPKSLNTHHIEKVSEHPERGADPTNLISLCKECHQLAHAGNTNGPVDPAIQCQLAELAEKAEESYHSEARVNMPVIIHALVTLAESHRAGGKVA